MKKRFKITGLLAGLITFGSLSAKPAQFKSIECGGKRSEGEYVKIQRNTENKFEVLYSVDILVSPEKVVGSLICETSNDQEADKRLTSCIGTGDSKFLYFTIAENIIRILGSETSSRPGEFFEARLFGVSFISPAIDRIGIKDQIFFSTNECSLQN